MIILENSLLGRWLLALWQVLFNWYQGSCLKRCVAWLYRLCGNSFDHSVVAQAFYKDGPLPTFWGTSWVVALITWVINLPATLLHWIYNQGKSLFTNSFFAQLAFSAGQQTSLAIGWLMAGILLCPYEHWNNMYSLTGFIVLLVLFYIGGMQDKSLRLDVTNIGPYGLFFAGAVVLSYLVSYSSALSFRYLFFHISGMLCVLLVVSSVNTPDQLRRLAGMATLGLGGMAAYGVFQGLEGVEVNTSYVDILLNADMPGRVFGMYENPNAFAEVMVMLVPVALALTLGSKTTLGKFGAGLATLLGTVAIGMTYSRASYVGLMVALCLFVFLWKRKIIPAFFLLALMAIPFLPDSIINRFLTIFNMNDTSTASRFPLYQAALDLIALRPIRGAGLGTDAVRTAVEELRVYLNEVPFVHAHNLYLQAWLELGLIGITTFLACMVSGVKTTAKAIRLPGCPHDVRLITLGAASAIVGILVNCLADYLWNYPRIMLIFWFVFSLLLAGVKLARQAHQEGVTVQ